MPINNDILNLNASIYDELRDKRGDNEALQTCINDTVNALFEQERVDDGMYKPVCLLGKIQSGKTRAFIGIIAKVLDEGVNTVIVLTKNSKILGEQTTKRIANEIHSVAAGRAVHVDYITSIEQDVQLGAAQLAQKRIIVGIKHFTNVEKIFKYVVENNPSLAQQKILIVDDEADVSSVGYRRVVENRPFETLTPEEQEEVINLIGGDIADAPAAIRTERMEMLLVAEGINKLRINLPEHTFLQVTATPASIFLQPEVITIENYTDDYTIEQVSKAPLLSDKTILLPIHSAYVGGEFFFGQRFNPESIAEFAFRDVSESELKFLSKRDQRHINNIFQSQNFPRLTEFVDNLLLAVASSTACIVVSDDNYTRIFEEDPIRVLNAIKTKFEGYSAMVHTSTVKGIHSYQTELVESYITHCKNIAENNPDNLKEILKSKLHRYFENSILPAFDRFKNDDSFQESYIQNLDRINFDFIFKCYCTILNTEHIQIFTINSDSQIEARIDSDTGELKREVLANIYIGGQSLDRGITLQRMLGFFYGREPRIAQLDTTLQHARLYGARKPEDLVFTRMYCSVAVHRRLSEITEIDAILRQSIINNDGDNRFATIELGANGQVRPTNPNRIMISNCINLRSYKRFLPVGFNTRTGNACENPMTEIDAIISENIGNSIPGFEGAEMCFINWTIFESIFKSFMKGMIQVDKWGDKPDDHNWNVTQLKAFYEIIKNSYFQDDNRIILSIKRGRAQRRLKIDGRFQDTPETARSDTVEMKSIMQDHNVPGLFLFEQAGAEDYQGDINYGWAGQRFYWPLFLLPNMQRNIMISLDALAKNNELE